MKIAGYNVKLENEFVYEGISYILYSVIDSHLLIIQVFDDDANKAFSTKIYNNPTMAINEFNETKNIFEGK